MLFLQMLVRKDMYMHILLDCKVTFYVVLVQRQTPIESQILPAPFLFTRGRTARTTITFGFHFHWAAWAALSISAEVVPLIIHGIGLITSKRAYVLDWFVTSWALYHFLKVPI